MSVKGAEETMPSKRKRNSLPDGRLEDSDTPNSASLVKKRKKSAQYDPIEIIQELYDTIRNHKTEDGRLLCETFIRVPKRRSAADYYDVVTTPIDLLRIQQKLKTDEYEDIDQLTGDIELMITNAKAYYKKNSQEYKDAVELAELYYSTKNNLLAEAFGDGAPAESGASRSMRTRSEEMDAESADEAQMQDDASASGVPQTLTEDDECDLEELFSAVMTAKEGGREISPMFQLLPGRTNYPEYYKVIKEPIDLKMIAGKIQGSHYGSLDELERDLLLMVKNAKSFNEPGSQIYKDAVSLKKVISTKKIELDHKRSGAMKTSERIRTRERNSGQRLSAVVAALKYASEEEPDLPPVAETSDSLVEYEEDSGGETTVSEEENLNWALFTFVKNYKNTVGTVLSEPFLKLPSRRFYVDYYEEIKNPMSIFNVRKKLKHNQYANLDELAADFDLVFENAKQYNQDGSRLYKDAHILQKAMREKKKELEKFDVKDFPLEELPPIYDCPLVHKLERDSWDEDESTSSSFKLKSNKNRKSIVEEKKKTPVKKGFEDSIKKRMTMLYKAVFDYTDSNGRPLRDIFMMLPLKKDYPDYYQVISQPIDMNMIDQRIKNDKYTSEQQVLSDFELLFNNARHYNEEDSQVYQDAETLEKVIKNKWKAMNPAFDSPKRSASKSKPKVKPVSPLCQKLTELYNTIKDYTDSRGRLLSTPFIKLPLKSDYPDYYEVIKKPVDMQRVQQRMSGNQYETVEDMVADFVQMFDNACKYNEPDSLIYKDALTLQRICLEKKAELTSDGNGNEVPDVRAIVQELMTNLFIATYNLQDEEGRCYSDSFAEIPEKDPEEEEEELKSGKPLTFDQIKRNLDKGRYRRVDRFQEDMFKVFERARRLSRTDSQVYEDAVEMQMFFIKQRDEMCKNGEILLTPALSYTEKHLQTALDVEKREKLPKEQREDEEKKKQAEEMDEKQGVQNAQPQEDGEDYVSFKEQTFHVGDFVYVEPREKSLEPHILCIERLYKDANDDQMLYGNWFYRPNETYHLATRKFLEKEVFKSDFFTQVPLSHVLGKCYVMFVKDYFKQRPEGFEDKDVYVSEFRYNARHKAFKKIKIWQVPRNDNVKILPRDLPLVPVRVASVFAEKGKSEEKDELDDGETHILDKVRINVLSETANPSDDDLTYYEQYNIPAGAFKIGDSVYVRSSEDRPLIARIDKIWTDQSGNPYFYGPWFVRPVEVEHAPTRLFFKREVFLSSIEDTNPMHSIMGKCSVQHIKEYLSCRIIEIPEHDVYICESKYLEAEKSIRKLAKGFKKCTLSPKVTDDEVYFFKKPVVPRKQEPSPLLAKASAEEPYVEMEIIPDTISEPPADTTSVSIEEPQTPQPEKSVKKKSVVKRVPSGYIVFAGEIRKTCQQENPDSSFGDISRIVGTKWRSLSKEDKERYEEKAKRLAEEQAAKQQEADRAFNESLNQNRSQSPWSDYGRSMSPGANSRPATPGGYSEGKKKSQQKGGYTSCYTTGSVGPYPPGYQSPGYPSQHGYPPPPGYPPHGYPPHQQGYHQYPGMRPMMGAPVSQGQTQALPPQSIVRGVPPGVARLHPSHQYGMQQGGACPPPGQTPLTQIPSAPHPTMSPGFYPGMCPSPLTGMSSTPTMAMAPPLTFPYGGGPLGVNCVPSHFMPAAQTSLAHSGQHLPPPAPPRPPSPMFVSVPPRTQRLLHSEAYIRYIESLNSESRTVGDFERSLRATQENTQPKSTTQLPTQWLGQGAGYHDSVVTALWALRDLMMKDTLNVQRTLSFDQLCE